MFEGEPGGAIYRSGKARRAPWSTSRPMTSMRSSAGSASRGETEEKMPVPSMGWFAPAKYPNGNPFSVWQSDQSAPMPQGMGAQSASSTREGGGVE